MTNSNFWNAPTPAEIEREQLFLDGYGMTVSPVICAQSVESRGHLSDKTELMARLTETMKIDGWEFAGAGYFAAVYVKGGLALKIGMKADDMGAMYAAWCRANQQLAGVPRIYGITKFTGCYLVLMHRYAEVALDDDDKIIDADIAEEFEELQNALAGRPFEQYDTALTARAIRDFFDGVADRDLHEGNVMLDEHGELVITDPLSFGTCSKDGGYSDYTDYTRVAD